MSVTHVNRHLLLINYAFKILPACINWVVFSSWQHKSSYQHCAEHMSTPFYTLFTIFTPRFLASPFSQGRNCWVLFHIHLSTLFPQQESDFKCAEHVKRWMKNVLLYDLASRSGLMSLMPCSAATVMMWSRAFIWPNIFTTSLIWSLLADMSYIKRSIDKTHSIILLTAPPIIFQQMELWLN